MTVVFYENSLNCYFFPSKYALRLLPFCLFNFLKIIFHIFFGQRVSCLTICFVHRAPKSARTSPFNWEQNRGFCQNL